MIAATLTLSMLEIILLLFGAIILGITIHFFIASRKSLRASTAEMEKSSFSRDEWKLRYFNDMEAKDRELTAMKQRVQEAEENSNIFSLETEEMRKNLRLVKTELDNARNAQESSPAASQQEIRELNEQIMLLQEELDLVKASGKSRGEEDDKTVMELRRQVAMLKEELDYTRKQAQQLETVEDGKPDYLSQLKEAQRSLIEHNQKINDLLGNIDIIREKEEKEREIMRDNEQLYVQLDDMRSLLDEKEHEIGAIKQAQHLRQEMTSRLDSAYNEFNVLQEKIQKLESQLTSSKMMNLELEDLREAHAKLMRDFDEQRGKSNRFSNENQQLQMLLSEVEDKLREANFQRQQLQKRVAYLEELNNDLQVVSDANKKLESQLRRVGELESMLNVVSEERDQLLRKNPR